MGRDNLKSASRSKKHRRRDASSSESKESHSDDDSPPRYQKSRKQRHYSPDNDKKKSEKQRKRKHDRKESSSEASDDSASPPKHTKYDREKQHDSRHRREISSCSKNSDKNKSGRDHRRDVEKQGHDSKRKHDRSPDVRIKREEDFDRRQDDARRNRRKDNQHRERNPYHFEVKQERHSDEEGRQNRHARKGNRNRNDIEQERRANEVRRAEAWVKRERVGGQNAEALVEDTAEPKEKEKPNLGLSGALTEDTNTYRGVVIKYSEPPEAKVPSRKWRLYPFKGDEALKVLHLHRQSAYLLGKLRRIADIPIDHPSCSKQHAVFQFRMVEVERVDGRKKRIVKPYIIDLDSANGTFVNNQKIQPRRYVELKEKDVIKFAFSSREYVLIHDKSDTTEVDTSGEENSDED